MDKLDLKLVERFKELNDYKFRFSNKQKENIYEKIEKIDKDKYGITINNKYIYKMSAKETRKLKSFLREYYNYDLFLKAKRYVDYFIIERRKKKYEE